MDTITGEGNRFTDGRHLYRYTTVQNPCIKGQEEILKVTLTLSRLGDIIYDITASKHPEIMFARFVCVFHLAIHCVQFSEWQNWHPPFSCIMTTKISTIRFHLMLSLLMTINTRSIISM